MLCQPPNWGSCHHREQCHMAQNSSHPMTTQKNPWLVGSMSYNTAHNTSNQNAIPYQPGRVAIFSLNKTAHQVSSGRQDPGRLGRFCWTTYQGRNNHTLCIVAGYRPSSRNNGHLSVMQQHWHTFKGATETNIHLHNQYWNDLQPILSSWIELENQIQIAMDVYKDIQLSMVQSFLKLWNDGGNCMMTQTNTPTNTQSQIQTYQWHLHHPGVFRPPLQVSWQIRSHCRGPPLHLDQSTRSLGFWRHVTNNYSGKSLQAQIWQTLHHQTIPHTPPKTLQKNNLFIKVQDIGKNIHGPEDLTPARQHKLNVLDDIQIQVMLGQNANAINFTLGHMVGLQKSPNT